MTRDNKLNPVQEQHDMGESENDDDDGNEEARNMNEGGAEAPGNFSQKEKSAEPEQEETTMESQELDMARGSEEDIRDQAMRYLDRKSMAGEKVIYEWEEELEEYDEPDVYPSEKDYQWFEEMVTDSEDEAEEKEEAEAQGEEEKGEEGYTEKKEDAAPPAETAPEGDEGAAEEAEEEHFVPIALEEEEEEEEVVGVPLKKYKLIKVKKLVERPPKIHHDPDVERIEFSSASNLSSRPFHFLHSFGYDCQRLANLHVLDNETLVFMSGFVLTFYNHTTHHKSYLRALSGSCFGALAIHPSRKLFAAAEKGKHPLIGIWSWKNLQLFRKLVDGTEKVYASINFSPDGKLLASQGGEPDFLITVWNWLKEIPVLRVKSHAQDVYRVTFSKELAGQLTTSGLCHIKFWKMAHTFTGLKLKGDLGRFGKTELTDIEGFVEMPDGKVVSGSEWGNLLVWENGLVIAELCANNDMPCHKGNVRFIMMVDGDFYTTGQDGMVKVWAFEAVDTAEIHTTEESLKVATKPNATVAVHEDADIWSIVPDPFSQDPVSVFWFAQDGRGIIWKVDLSFLNTAKESQPVVLTHGGPIVACATSPMTYLVSTLGADGKINVYDYVRRQLVGTRGFNAPGSCLLWPELGTDEKRCTLVCGFANGVLRILRLSRFNGDQGPQLLDLPMMLILHKAWKPHRRSVTCLALDNDAELLITGSEDGTVFFFSVTNDFMPMLYVALPGYEPIRKLLWSDDTDEQARIFIAVCDGGIIQQLQVSNVFNFDNTVSYFSTESTLLSFMRIKSIKSFLRHNEHLERIRIAEEEREAALETELRRLVDEGVETQSEQDIRLLMETEEREREEASKPESKEKKWKPYLPPTPSPILEVLIDQLLPDMLHLTMGAYDTGYVFSVKLLPLQGDTDIEHRSDEPIDAIPVENCDDVAITRITVSKGGESALVGFQDGRVRFIKLGLEFDIKSMEKHWTEGIHDLVRGAITSLTFDFEENFMFSSGDDGNCFMFSLIPTDRAQAFCCSAETVDMPCFDQVDVADIYDEDEYTLEDSKNIAKEMAILAAAKKNKAAKKEEIARLRRWFTDVVKRNNELPEEVRLTPVEFSMAADNVIRHEEAKKERLAQLNLETAWESARASIAHDKLKSFYKDTMECELFVLKAFDSEMRVTSFRLPKLPDFFSAAIKTYYNQIPLNTSVGDIIVDVPSDVTLVVVKKEPRPKRTRGMDKFVYQRLVRLWQRRQKKVLRQRQWSDFLRTDPADKELEDDVHTISAARENMGDLKLKTHADYKAPEHLRLTVNRARKRLIDLEQSRHDLMTAFNKEMLELRGTKIKYIARMNKFMSRLITARNLLPAEMQKPLPHIPEMTPDENPNLSTSVTREEILAYKTRQTAKVDAFGADKATRAKKVEPSKRRPGRAAPQTAQQQQLPLPQQQLQAKATISPAKDLGNFVQVVNFPPSALENHINHIALTKNTFHQDYSIECIAREKHRFDTLLKLLLYKKVKLDYYIKTAETEMVLRTEEFLQAQKCEHVESSLENKINKETREKMSCTSSLKSLNKQIDIKKKELEEINEQRAALLKEVLDISTKAPQYEHYLIRVFKKKIYKAKESKRKSEDDDDDDESDDSDESDDMDMEEDEETDDDLDVDLPPQDLKPEIYDTVVQVRGRRGKVDDREELVKQSIDELQQQANGFKSRIGAAERALTQTRSELDAFIFDKQNKLNSIDFAVSVHLHQILYMASNLNEALITTQSTIRRLRERIPELKKEKKMEKKNVAQTRRMFTHLQHTKRAFMERLDEMSNKCDEEMLFKFGHVRPIQELEYFEGDSEIRKLEMELQQLKNSSWAEEQQLRAAVDSLQCTKVKLSETAATTLMVRAELIEELFRMNTNMENTFKDLTVKASSSNYREDIAFLKKLVLRQWDTLRDLQLEIASLTWRPNRDPVPAIGTRYGRL